MLRIGLSGGIGAGKSTVSSTFAAEGGIIVDGDVIAREVVEPGTPGYQEVVRTFGDGILAEDQSIDRKKLGAIVFSDDSKRRQLNGITHPRIAAATAQKLAALAQSGVKQAFYEAALLVENGVHHGLSGLIVVAAPIEKQVERVCQRDGLSEDEARARIAAQLPLAEKVKSATWVIDSGGSLDDTRAQVNTVWQQILNA